MKKCYNKKPKIKNEYRTETCYTRFALACAGLPAIRAKKLGTGLTPVIPSSERERENRNRSAGLQPTILLSGYKNIKIRKETEILPEEPEAEGGSKAS